MNIFETKSVYQTPQVEIIHFEVEDILLSSNGTPWDPWNMDVIALEEFLKEETENKKEG